MSPGQLTSEQKLALNGKSSVAGFLDREACLRIIQHGNATFVESPDIHRGSPISLRTT